MLRKLKIIWKILISDQYRVFTYRYHRYDPNDAFVHADYASWARSDNTDALDRYFNIYFKP